MQIRFATKNDINDLVLIYQGWAEFKGILPDQLVEPDTRDDLIQYFDGSNRSRKYLLATDDDNLPMGACYIDITFLILNNIRIGDMIVKKDFRNQGVGSAIFDKILKYARENNVKKIWLWTQEELESAKKFYTIKGFILEGKQKNQFCNKDALLFGLIL